VAVTCLTGAAHVAAGLALLTNRLPRLAAVLEAAMMSVFVLLINVPDVLSEPENRGSWLTLWAEGALVAAAWIIAAALRESGTGDSGISQEMEFPLPSATISTVVLLCSFWFPGERFNIRNVLSSACRPFVFNQGDKANYGDDSSL
jgi:hypothetical protein